MKLKIIVIGLFFVAGASAKESVNVAITQLADARKAAIGFVKDEATLNKILPNFDSNYTRLQDMCKKARNIKRIDMPVIKPDQIQDFINRLKNGQLDVNEPYVKSIFFWSPFTKKDDRFDAEHFPKNLNTRIKYVREKWLNLGDKNKDKVKITTETIKVKNLKPIQSEIWLSKLVNDINMFGSMRDDKNRHRKFIIIGPQEADGLSYVVDGNHVYGKIFLTDPELDIIVVRIHLPIELILKVGRSYGNAKGNEQQQ